MFLDQNCKITIIYTFQIINIYISGPEFTDKHKNIYISTIIPIKIIFKLFRTKTYKRYVLLYIKSLISLHADTMWIRRVTQCHLKIKQKEN